jgi:hypothetical protein
MQLSPFAHSKKGGYTMPAIVSFAKDIAPLFTATDVAHMSFFCDLSKYADNKTHAQQILQRLKGQGGALMPPPPASPWTVNQITLYEEWIAGGFQP